MPEPSKPKITNTLKKNFSIFIFDFPLFPITANPIKFRGWGRLLADETETDIVYYGWRVTLTRWKTSYGRTLRGRGAKLSPDLQG